jgi:hypothetical protein
VGGAVGLGLSANEFLHRDRCIAWCGVLLVLELLGFLFVAALSYGLIETLPRPVTTSFVSFYAAGALADAGTPALAYDSAAHEAAEDHARSAGIAHPLFTYPPVFLLHCGLLARLPYLPAFLVFQAATLAALLLALRHILDIRRWDAAGWRLLLPFLAFPALWENAALGQNAFLTASLFAWGLVLLPARSMLAGLLLGSLCYKPHFGLLVPVALAAGQHWRAIAGAALSVAGWLALSLVTFGTAPWLAYAAALPAMPATYQSGRIAFAAMVSPLGAARVLGVSPAASYGVQIASALAATASVAWVWRQRAALPLRAATLLAGTLLLAPLVLVYDLTMAAVAMAFLVRHARRTGWLAHEKPLLGLVLIASLFAPLTAIAWSIPLGPLPAVLLLALCLAHARTPLA